MSAEAQCPRGEPTPVYLDRTVMERAQLIDQDSVARERQAVLDHVDANLAESYTTVASYLAQPPDVYGVRDAERIARHLAAHPLLGLKQRQEIATLFNETVSRYGLDDCGNKKRQIAFIDPAMAELSLPVDDLVEVR